MPATARSNAAAPYALLLPGVVFWGSSFWATQIAVGHTPAIMLAALRTAPVGVFLLALPLLGKPYLRGREQLWAA